MLAITSASHGPRGDIAETTQGAHRERTGSALEPRENHVRTALSHRPICALNGHNVRPIQASQGRGHPCFTTREILCRATPPDDRL